MPTLTDDAVCLRRWDFSETSQTVSLFGREHGVLRGLAKGAKRPHSRFSGGFDILTRGQVVAIVKPGRDLANLTEWNLVEVYRAVRERLEANRAGLYMADAVHHMLREHDPHPELFDVFVAALGELAVPGGAAPALLGFQWALLLASGYRPELDRDAATGAALPAAGATLAFSPGDGGVAADTGEPGRWRVRRATVDLLRRVAAGEPAGSAAAEVVERANRLLAAYLRELLGQEPAAMRWMFGPLERGR
ncbi:MAG: DNA repair protein RecO [Planctomycetota bacterium]